MSVICREFLEGQFKGGFFALRVNLRGLYMEGLIF